MSGENLKVAKLNINNLTQTVIDTASAESALASSKPLLFNTGLIDSRKYSINGQPQQAAVKGSVEEALFDAKVKSQQESPKTAQVKTEELPVNVRTGALAAIGNYFNRVRYGVDRLDTVIDNPTLDVIQRYSIPESDLKTMYESNPRLQAIISQMMQTGANYGIQMA